MITLTSRAVQQVKSLIAEQNNPALFLRIGVQGGGCSGLEYFLALDDTRETDDLEYEFEGLKVLIDPGSLPYIEGSTLDFSNDLMNSGFIFNNPNAVRSCGCGKSFCS